MPGRGGLLIGGSPSFLCQPLSQFVNIPMKYISPHTGTLSSLCVDRSVIDECGFVWLDSKLLTGQTKYRRVWLYQSHVSADQRLIKQLYPWNPCPKAVKSYAGVGEKEKMVALTFQTMKQFLHAGNRQYGAILAIDEIVNCFMEAARNPGADRIYGFFL